MNRNYLTVVLLAASLLISFSATGRAEEKPEVLYTSPSGAIRIERSGENAWVVSTKDPTQRAKMPPLEGSSPAAIARSQVTKAHSSATGIIENARRISILFRFLVGHAQHGRFVFRVEANRHSLAAPSQFSVHGFPSLVVNDD